MLWVVGSGYEMVGKVVGSKNISTSIKMYIELRIYVYIDNNTASIAVETNMKTDLYCKNS